MAFSGSDAAFEGFRLVRRNPMALVAWALVAVAVLVELFGELLQLPEWLRDVSPFHHLPGLPAQELRMLPVVTLLVLATTLAMLGLRTFRDRDLAVG